MDWVVAAVLLFLPRRAILLFTFVALCSSFACSQANNASQSKGQEENPPLGKALEVTFDYCGDSPATNEYYKNHVAGILIKASDQWLVLQLDPNDKAKGECWVPKHKIRQIFVMDVKAEK